MAGSAEFDTRLLMSILAFIYSYEEPYTYSAHLEIERKQQAALARDEDAPERSLSRDELTALAEPMEVEKERRIAEFKAALLQAPDCPFRDYFLEKLILSLSTSASAGAAFTRSREPANIQKACDASRYSADFSLQVEFIKLWRINENGYATESQEASVYEGRVKAFCDRNPDYPPAFFLYAKVLEDSVKHTASIAPYEQAAAKGLNFGRQFFLCFRRQAAETTATFKAIRDAFLVLLDHGSLLGLHYAYMFLCESKDEADRPDWVTKYRTDVQTRLEEKGLENVDDVDQVATFYRTLYTAEAEKITALCAGYQAQRQKRRSASAITYIQTLDAVIRPLADTLLELDDQQGVADERKLIETLIGEQNPGASAAASAEAADSIRQLIRDINMASAAGGYLDWSRYVERTLALAAQATADAARCRPKSRKSVV